MKIEGRLLTRESGEAVFVDAYVLLIEDEIESIAPFTPLLRLVHATGHGLLIVAEDIGEDVVVQLEQFSARRSIRCRAISAPGFGTRRHEILADIAVLTGTHVVSPTSRNLSLDQLGRAGRIEVGQTATALQDGKGLKKQIRRRVDELRTTFHQTTSDYDREKLGNRLANLLAGIAGGEGSLPVSTRELPSNPKPPLWEPWWAARRLAHNWGLLGAGLALVMLGVGLGLVGRLSWEQATHSQHWPTTQGEIMSSEVVRDYMVSTERYVTYAQVRYGYTMEGTHYQNDRIRFRGGIGGRPTIAALEPRRL